MTDETRQLPVETPAARWRVGGLPDPHGRRYDGERAKLCHGEMTDDELANAVYLNPSIDLLTAAKERIRWLSRRLVEAETVPHAIAAIPNPLYWLIGKGRTRPSEPLYACQLIDAESGIAIAEAEAEQLADAINAAIKQLNTSHRPEGDNASG